jgi:hypothetical protein
MLLNMLSVLLLGIRRTTRITVINLVDDGLLRTAISAPKSWSKPQTQKVLAVLTAVQEDRVLDAC